MSSLCNPFHTTHDTCYMLFQVDFSDATKLVDVFLQLSSVYKEDAEVKKVVFEIAGMSEMLYGKKLFLLLLWKIFVGH